MTEPATTPAAPAPASAPPAAAPTLFGGAAPAAPAQPAAQPAAGTPPPAAGDPNAAAAADPWAKWDADRRGFFENKGWLKNGKLDVDALAEGYHQLERFKGVSPEEAYRLSKNPTPDELSRVHKKLGVPETPDGYGLKAAPGQDPALLNEIAKVAHENKVTPSQLQAFLKLNQTLHQRTVQEADRQAGLALQRGAIELSQEWGGATEQNKAIARRAANLQPFLAHGMDEGFWAHAAKYPGVGPVKIAKALHALGLGLGEDRFVTGDQSGNPAQRIHTPASAQARIDEIMRNPATRRAAINASDPQINAELEALNKAIIGYKG